MNVGDKVRILRGKEEGIVTRIIDQKLIEIEIEDGFQIPVLKNEVVVVSREESNYFKREETQAAAPAPAVVKKGGPNHEGYYVAFKPLNDRLLSIHLINNTEDIILYSILEEKDGLFHSLISGHLKGRQAHKFAQADMQQFDQWPVWHLRLLPHPFQSVTELPATVHQRVQPKAGSFFKSMRDTPVLNSKAYLIPLTAASKMPAAAAQDLQDRLQNPKEEKKAAAPERIPAEVDLHLDKLVDDPKRVAAVDILPLQLETFEKVLDRAIASGLDEITFIHGVGNGTLRKEIHRRLSNINTIAWFKDAQKEKWGYGATQVRLK